MQNEKLKIVGSHLVCVVIGIVLTLATIGLSKILSLMIWGFELQSVMAFPDHHQAKLYSRPGFGEQNFTFWVDSKIVWNSVSAPGNFQEKVYWDKVGNIVTLELEGRKMIVYDAVNREVKHKSW
jgi:hypothetical protein